MARLNGTGTLKYSNGDIYKGGWKMNKREGAGVTHYQQWT